MDLNKMEGGINRLPGTPEIASNIHWVNSSNVLCNFMPEPAYLDLILNNKAIIPRYCMEDIRYLKVPGRDRICFPMTCFCDIPFSKVSTHMLGRDKIKGYGEYGIAFYKKSLISTHRIQPIHYINENSPIVHDFQEAFFVAQNEKLEGEQKKLAAYIVSTLLYMKPIWGIRNDAEGNEREYVYQDECEWRYIPSDNFPHELHLVLRKSETTEKGKNIYQDVINMHPECWLKFEWDDVAYIIVPDEAAVKHVIDTISKLNISTMNQRLLISKIEISRRFADNM